MFLVVIENHYGYASAFIMEEEDVTASWLTKNFLTVMGAYENEDEAIKALAEDGWEYEQSRDTWISYGD